MSDFIEINTDDIKSPQVGNDLFENRATVAAMHRENTPEVTIIVQAYNRLEKTKRCVDSILKYTANIDYELLLIDNGSTDGTTEYFLSVPYEKKRVIHITKNLEASYPNTVLSLNDFAQFVAQVNNDLIVTEHWLDNLLTCIKSDPKIGMVNPVSSNASNLQGVELSYKSYEEMQEQASRFNRSDPRKWEDRLRLITLGTVYRKEVLLCLGWPLWDSGFFHDFGDDDVTFAVRRAGYRTVLAGDTWICHDHDYSRGENKNLAEYQRSLEIGRQNFRDKYFGIDSWEDVNNYLLPYLEYFPTPKKKELTHVLGVDVRCGTPLLDIKNMLRKANVFHVELSAFTQEPKYWTDLKTICKGTVACDREEFLEDWFVAEKFDYVMIDRPINCYHEPQKLLQTVFALCKKGGCVILKLKNTGTFREYVNLLGQRQVYDPAFAYNMPIEAVHTALRAFGHVLHTIAIPFHMSREQQDALSELLPSECSIEQRDEIMGRMLCNEYLLMIEKK